jgi:hypothetical protein
MRYQRTQRSYLLHWIIVPLVLVGLGGLIVARPPLWVWPLALGYLAALSWITVTFSMLTVLVDGDQIRVYFGRGWPRKTIATQEIVAIGPVRNQWWYGLGIRWIPNGTLWNVWGLDAVEFELRSGKVFRLGTDDAEGLIASL